MANDINHKDLYQRLGNIKEGEEWLKAAECLGLRICCGSKHPATIRDPDLPDDNGKASLITVVQSSLHKRMNQRIFKEMLRFEKDEDKIWRCLGMLR